MCATKESFLAHLLEFFIVLVMLGQELMWVSMQDWPLFADAGWLPDGIVTVQNLIVGLILVPLLERKYKIALLVIDGVIEVIVFIIYAVGVPNDSAKVGKIFFLLFLELVESVLFIINIFWTAQLDKRDPQRAQEVDEYGKRMYAVAVMMFTLSFFWSFLPNFCTYIPPSSSWAPIGSVQWSANIIILLFFIQLCLVFHFTCLHDWLHRAAWILFVISNIVVGIIFLIFVWGPPVTLAPNSLASTRGWCNTFPYFSVIAGWVFVVLKALSLRMIVCWDIFNKKNSNKSSTNKSDEETGSSRATTTEDDDQIQDEEMMD